MVHPLFTACVWGGYLCAHVWGCSCQGEGIHVHMYGSTHVKGKVPVCTWVGVHMSGGISVHMCGGIHGGRVSTCRCVGLHTCTHAHEGQRLRTDVFNQYSHFKTQRLPMSIELSSLVDCPTSEPQLLTLHPPC